SWVEQPGAGLDRTFADLRGAERRGGIPPLVFSPLLVEDAPRLLLSKPSPHHIVTKRGGPPSGPPGGAPLLSPAAVRLVPPLPPPPKRPGFPGRTGGPDERALPVAPPRRDAADRPAAAGGRRRLLR